MTLYVLKIKADLENIDKIIANINNLWKFNVASSSGVESGEIRKGITISDAELLDLDGSRGQVLHCTVYCMLCAICDNYTIGTSICLFVIVLYWYTK